MSKYYILLRPEHKIEKEKAKKNGAGFRTGYILPYPLLDGLELVNDEWHPYCYQKIGDKRDNVSLISFKSELAI